jgi:hypothetical protein
MNTPKCFRTFLVCGLIFVLRPLPGSAQTNSGMAKTGDQNPSIAVAAPRDSAGTAGSDHDGQHDFDFELGSWKIHLKRLENPLTGSTKWIEFDGTTVTRKIWDGRAQIEEFETKGEAGRVEGMTLRLYRPEAHQWYLYWANGKDGILGVPTVGEFKNGVGEFYDQELYHGRMILLRFIWSRITPNSAHFEQSFSDDGGKTWEVNWVTDQTRVPESEKEH